MVERIWNCFCFFVEFEVKKMMVANSFDLWQKDVFFSAAEEVQESADAYVLHFSSIHALHSVCSSVQEFGSWACLISPFLWGFVMIWV